MRLKPFLPPPLFAAARNAYWKRFWQDQLREQQQELGAESAPTLVGSERALLAEAIGDCYPFHSLLEVGCSFGQLFHVIAPQYPNVRMAGIDPDAERIDAGGVHLAKAGIKNVTLGLGAAEDLSGFQSGAFDLVVTSAALLYVRPEKIEQAIAEIGRVAKKAVLLLEQHNPDGESIEIADPLGRYWIRDYRQLLAKHFPDEAITVARVNNPLWRTESWQTTGYLIAAKRWQ